MGREQCEEECCSELELIDYQSCCWKFSHKGDTVWTIKQEDNQHVLWTGKGAVAVRRAQKSTYSMSKIWDLYHSVDRMVRKQQTVKILRRKEQQFFNWPSV